MAIANSSDILTLETLTVLAKRRVDLVLAGASEIQEAINRNYKAYREIEEQFSSIDSPLLDEIAVEVTANAPVVRAAEIRAQAGKEGMVSMLHDAMLKVRAGLITAIVHIRVLTPLATTM